MNQPENSIGQFVEKIEILRRAAAKLSLISFVLTMSKCFLVLFAILSATVQAQQPVPATVAQLTIDSFPVSAPSLSAEPGSTQGTITVEDTQLNSGCIGGERNRAITAENSSTSSNQLEITMSPNQITMSSQANIEGEFLLQYDGSDGSMATGSGLNLDLLARGDTLTFDVVQATLGASAEILIYSDSITTCSLASNPLVRDLSNEEWSVPLTALSQDCNLSDVQAIEFKFSTPVGGSVTLTSITITGAPYEIVTPPVSGLSYPLYFFMRIEWNPYGTAFLGKTSMDITLNGEDNNEVVVVSGFPILENVGFFDWIVYGIIPTTSATLTFAIGTDPELVSETFTIGLPDTATCSNESEVCVNGPDCCSGNCTNGFCGDFSSCFHDGALCSSVHVCCSGACSTGGVCNPNDCMFLDETCNEDAECCSGKCNITTFMCEL